MEEKQLLEFFNKFSNNQHTDKEHEAFVSWIKTLPEQAVADILAKYEALNNDRYAAPPELLASKIEDRLDTLSQEKVISMWPKLIKIAAACVILITSGLFFYNKSHRITVDQQTVAAISIGGNKAILKLADGKEIILDSAKLGMVTSQSGTEVVKTEDGHVSFIPADKNQSATNLSYNLISIPRGGQYAVILPDGTKVWLNSASSLKFPNVFAKNERLVEITGEAYFEVAKDKTKPFRVKTATQSLEVLGTHFNINAYSDEPVVATTLMEGSVKLSALANGKTQLLKPGQQARFANDFTVSELDAMTAIDWKNGNFRFAKENIATIMRKISRWYDVDVVYHGKITQEGFVGMVPRSKNIEEVLDALKLTGLVNYKIEGKQITITP